MLFSKNIFRFNEPWNTEHERRKRLELNTIVFQDMHENRRELAFKAVLILCLCITLASWACMCTVFPFLYQFMNIANTQMGKVLEFCEVSSF